MKKILLATMLGASLAANAATVDLDFTYASDEVGFYGLSRQPQSYDVAIYLPGELFKGSKIKSIYVPMYTAAGISNYSSPSVWLSSTLSVANEANNPDIASYAADFEYSGSYSILGLNLPEEYTVTEEGVYVGYSFTVTKNDTGTQYPLTLSPGGNPNGFFFRENTSDWTNMYPANDLSSALTVSLTTSNLPDANVSVVSVPDLVLTKVGDPANFSVTLNTSAGVAVNSIDYELTFNGNTSASHYELPAPVGPTFGTTFDVAMEIPACNELAHGDATVKILKVNGMDNVSTGKTANVDVAFVSQVPVRNTLLEEFTCTKCGYCTRGYAALEYLKTNYPDYICVSYHNNFQGSDPMTVTENYPVTVTGNPNASLNRVLQGIDPYYGTQTYDEDLPILGDIRAQNSISTPWNIKVGHSWVDDDHLQANVEVSNVIGYDNGDYKIGYLLVSDGLTGTTSSWRQTNYYSSETPQFIPELNDFCRGGIYGKSKVVGLVFNDVVIDVTGYMGVDNSIPASLAAEAVAEHSQTWDLTTIKSALLPDKNKLRIVAFVLDRNGQVVNAAKQDVTDFVAGGGSSVEDIEAADADAPVEYYNLSGVKVDNPQGGIFIRRQGSHTSKVIIK